MQGTGFADYRVYVLDRRGHFIWAHEFSAPNDGAALRQAMTLDLPYGGEIWQQGRKVALVSTAAGSASVAYGVGEAGALGVRSHSATV